MESLACGVERRFSGFATRTTKRTIVLDAKLVENFLPIAVCPGYCDRTGRAHSKNSRLSIAAGSENFAAITTGFSPIWKLISVSTWQDNFRIPRHPTGIGPNDATDFAVAS